MVEVNWTERSKLLLNDIVDYIAQDNPTAALKVAKGIVGKTKILELFPRAGSFWADSAEGDQRSLIYGRYRIGYRIVSEEEIHILGVYDCARDLLGPM